VWGLDAGDLTAGAIGLLGVVIGGWGLKRASEANAIASDSRDASWQATAKADVANRIALEANGLSKEANATAKESVAVAQRSADASDRSAIAAEQSAQWAQESAKLQKQGLQLQANQQYWEGRANLSVRPGPRDSTGRMTFLVENHGKGQAFDISTTFRVRDSTFGPFERPSLEVGKTWTIEGSWGNLFGPTDSMPDEPEDQRPRLATLATLKLNFRDGNGTFQRWFTVMVGPGRRFADMNVELQEEDLRKFGI
jgi:hypothetical protein